MDSSVFSLTGDAASIRSSSVKWSQFSSAAASAAGDVRRIDSGDFIGDEAETFRDRLDQDLPPHLETTSVAWQQVAGALTVYATALEDLQTRMAAVSSRASDQQGAITAADSAVADARTADARHAASVTAGVNALKPGQSLPPDSYQMQAVGASGQLGTANAALQASTDVANQIRSEHNAAIDACVNAISGASGLRFEEPPGFWGRLGNAVTGWISDNADVLKAISGVLKQISGIAGLLAMIPILAPIMGPIAAFSGAGSVLLDSAVMYATGEGTATDLLMDAAGVIPGGRAVADTAKGAAVLADAAKTVTTVAKDAKTVTAVAKDAKTAETLASEARTAETAASDARSVDAAAVGRGKAGNRAADSSDTAAKNSTPADSLPCKGDPIDIVSGHMIMVQTDLELPGVLPLVFKRVYKTSYRWGGVFGRSWASTLDQRVEVGVDGGACFVAEDGVVLYYPHATLLEVGVPVWPTAGVRRWPLRRIADGRWTVHDPEAGMTRRFAAADATDSCALLDMTDRHGNSISFDYDATGIVCAVRHSAGYRVVVTCTDRRVTALAVDDLDTAATVVSFGYDNTGNLLRVNNSDGEPLILEWDDKERIVGWTDRNGIWYRYEFDPTGRCVQTSGRGRVLSYGFAYLPGRTLVTDSLGAVSVHEFNEAGQITREIDPLGNATASVWDRFDRLLLRTDPLGRSTQFEYDRSGRLIGVIHPDGNRESCQRNELGLPERSVDATGAVWSRSYDGVGNLLSVTDPLAGTTAYRYGSTGAVESVTDEVGSVTSVVSDRNGLPVQIVDAVGGCTLFGYDSFGRVVRVIDPVGGVTTIGWTTEGKLSNQMGPDGAREEWTWDGEGNLAGHVNAAGARTVIENGVFDLPVARTGPDGGTMRFGYDTELRLTSVQNPAGLRWLYIYDAAGRLVGETDFNGRTQTYRHDAAGRLIGMINGLGSETRLSYDAAGDLVERVTADGVTRMTYDTAGRIIRAENPGTVVHVDRDSCGRVVRETVNGRSVSAGFDAAGRPISRLTPAGVLSQWEFDPIGRPRALSTAGQRIGFVFDAAGREVGRNFSSGGRLTQRFDGAHRLVQQVMGALVDPAELSQTPAVAPLVSATSRNFAYRIDGALAGISNETTGGSRRFDLDTAGRVVGVRAAGWTEGYAYDRSGNVTAAAVHGHNDGRGHNDGHGHNDGRGGADRAARHDYTGTLITAAGNISYGHDRQGRVVTRSRKRLSRKPETWQYRYDADDRMIEARTEDERWLYAYDPFGRRISKQRIGAHGGIAEQILFSWDGDRLIEQTHSDGGSGRSEVTTWEYLPGSWRPISQTVGGTDDAQFYAIVSDLIGTPTELVTPDGAQVAWSNADSHLWGAPVTGACRVPATRFRKSAVDCPIRFPGQYADRETGLHYNRHRYYDPASARYTTTDPLGLAPADDPHSYVRNPTGWADPLGLAPCDPAGLVGHEANGGHTIDRHVGKSDEYLAGRGKKHASTFPDLATASKETASNLNQNAGAIWHWLRHSPADVIAVNGALAQGAGVTLIRATAKKVASTGIETRLIRDPSMTDGFGVITSFPTP